MKNFPQKTINILVGITCILLLLLPNSDVQAQESIVPVTVVITWVHQIHCDEGWGEDCPNDFYAAANIAGLGWQKSDIEWDSSDYAPVWTFSRQVDMTKGTIISIDIKLLDYDEWSDDDDIDISSGDNDDRTLNLQYDLITHDWWGDVPTNQRYSEGSGNDSASITFEIDPLSDGDFDDDGIPDSIERFGILDGNGNLHTNMAALGADPCRKNIAVEVDYMAGAADGHDHMPDPQAIAEVVAAFDNAPIPVAQNCPYAGFPTRQSGIGLIVDINNAVPEQPSLQMGPEGLDWDVFFAIQASNFDNERRPYFHYNLWAHNLDPNFDAGGIARSTTYSSKSFIVSLGSWHTDCVNAGQNGFLDSQLAGDDVLNGTTILDGPNRTCDSTALGDDTQGKSVGTGPLINQRGTVREQSADFMHELGHTLGLEHGGGDPINCKPNYLSVMNYDISYTGILDPTQPANVDTNNDGVPDHPFRLDYSRSALWNLHEDRLFEANGIQDGTDWTLWSLNGQELWIAPGNRPIDWNQNGIIDNTIISQDLNFRPDINGSQGCSNQSPNQTLEGFNDWEHIKFRAAMSPFVGYAPPYVGPELGYETVLHIYEQTYEAINTTDLAITKSAVPSFILNNYAGTTPVTAVAGTQMDYVITITNNGPNATQKAQVIDTLPTGVKYIGADVSCVEAPIGTLTCDPGLIAGYESRDLHITVLIDADLVYRAGGPTTITNNATIKNVAGLDLNETNNSASVDVQVVAAADLSITKSASPDPVAAGNVLQYTVTVKNNGPSVAEVVNVVDILPQGVSLVSNSSESNCVLSDVTLTCGMGGLAVGATVATVIGVHVNADLVYKAGGPTTITNQVSVTGAADTVDPDMSNNTASVDTRVIAVADLEINSFTAIDPPAEALIGENIKLTVREVIVNHGPSGPMNAELINDVTATDGGTGKPNNPTLQAMALDVNEQREIFDTYTIKCIAPGQQTFTLATKIQPLNSEDTDPDQSNNVKSIRLDVECVVPVAIDIKPKMINLKSNRIIPVVVLTTQAGEFGLPLSFDASSIDPLSVRFGPHNVVWFEIGGAKVIHGPGHRTGVGMMLQFSVRDSKLVAGSTEACVKGTWIGANSKIYKFFGCDEVVIKD
jgi:uncharacterized repeat protein (TIGR01451 family)